MDDTRSSVEGWGSGLLGVIIFSGSLPATRVAVADFSPLFLTSARAVIAALLGAALLMLLRQARPQRRDMLSLAIVSIGVVIGFPLLTALALQHITSAHSIVFIGLLPLATAIFGVLRGGERPKPLFWLFSCLGSATVVAFAVSNGGASSPTRNLFLISGLFLFGGGVAGGGQKSRRPRRGAGTLLGVGVSAPPVRVLLQGALSPFRWRDSAPPPLSLAYVSVFSMLVGFVFWYRGLALGGIAGVGQLQLLQPFFGLALAGLLLGEPVAWTMIAATGLIVVFVAFAKRFA